MICLILNKIEDYANMSAIEYSKRNSIDLNGVSFLIFSIKLVALDLECIISKLLTFF